MLEQLLIFTRGGLILWTYKEIGNALRGSPIDTLIRSCLLEERSGYSSFQYDAPGASYTLKWTFHNDLGLVFVAVYQRILHLLYVDDLLSLVKKEFAEIYDVKRTSYSDFGNIFLQLKKEAEVRAEEMKKSKQVSKPVDTHSSRKQGQSHKFLMDGGNQKKSGGESGGDGGDGDNFKGRTIVDGRLDNGENKDVKLVNGKDNGSTNTSAFDVNKLQKLRSKGGKKTEVANKGSKVDDPKKKVAKMNRVWDDSPKDTKWDFSDPVSENGEDNVTVLPADTKEKSMMDKEEIVSSDSETEDDDDTTKNDKVDTKRKGWLSTMFQSFAGKPNLEMSDLEPALKSLKDRLMTKNVAEEIAEKLCQSVAASLEGKRLASFTRISSTVQSAMEDALVRIMTPKRSIDILRDVHVAKEQRKPYVIVFIGVNGVGKSTNLAKV
ncbi:hypothetical protein M569_15062 [Genlisea aurea]|uniref:Signal recognition particle receptor alpha subunit N-terminal domain-containing protein n=1 Tax=Genlisea aurea TaxID=192259 RepID=S8DAL9_9LAMI|nr:hypothetical protein M569_15062 [Genlisea aurea]